MAHCLGVPGGYTLEDRVTFGFEEEGLLTFATPTATSSTRAACGK